MAAIHDLISQVEDEVLRCRLAEELSRLTKEKTFGLVFETHLPELTPLYAAQVVKGATVARRKGPVTDLWRVLSVIKGHAHCIHRTSSQQQEMEVTELVVVRQFGEPIFPSLVPVDRVANGPENGPWHTLIEAADLRDRNSWPELHAWLLRRPEELRITFAKRVKTLALPIPR